MDDEKLARRKAETIRIGEFEYAKVSTRLMEMHEKNALCAIETTYEFKEGWVIFTATVHTERGKFDGHSMGKVTVRQKEFEKLESISVGRALAFAGFLASGEIACYEEMADIVPSISSDVPFEE